MSYKGEALFLDKEGEPSSLPDWIRSSYDFSIVILESSRMAYGGDSGSYDDIEMVSDIDGNYLVINVISSG